MSGNNKGMFMVPAALAICTISTYLLSQYYSEVKTAPKVEVESNGKTGSEYPPEIKNELFARVRSFFGDKGIEKLNDSFVIVVGLGGVGSHCAHMLVRSGVGRVRLIDFDQVTLSSLNRHALATIADVGISKAEAMKRRLLSIIPWCKIDAVTQMFKAEDADTLLGGNPDYVIDCIDDVNTKAELISYCIKNNIPVITSMGAGGKADPTRLRIAPLSECINDPLSQKIRWKMKKHNVSAEHVLAVFSIEKPICNLLPLDEEQRAAPQDFGTVDYLRLRIMPVLGTSPSIFGQALAAYLLCKLADKIFEPETTERLSHNLKHKLRNVFKKNELLRFKTEQDVNMDDEDIEFVVQQVWGSRCAVTKSRFGGHIILTLTRWDATQPPSPYNLVLMMQKEALKLAEEGIEKAFSKEVITKIENRLAWAKQLCEREEKQDDMKFKYMRHNNSLNEYLLIEDEKNRPNITTATITQTSKSEIKNQREIMTVLSSVLLGATITSTCYSLLTR